MKYVQTIAVFLAMLIVMLPVAFADTLNLIYDGNGNLVSGDGSYRVYNSLNQLWKVYNGSDATGALLQEYTYHPIEERVLIKQSFNSSANETVYYVNKDFIRIVNDSGTYDVTYVFHEGQLVAERDNDGTKVYHHPDHLGSTSLITDSGGNLLENSFYSPYGVILDGGEESRYDYEGKEFDDVTGQYDFHFRGYKADWGIFVQPDSLLPNVYDPQQLNRYSFERGNPWSSIDPDGHLALSTLVIVLTMIVLVVGLVKYAMDLYETRNEEPFSENRNKAHLEGVSNAAGGLGSISGATKKLVFTPALEAYDLKNKVDGIIKEGDDDESKKIPILKVDRRDPNVILYTYDHVDISEFEDGIHTGLTDEGWAFVESGGSSGGYYCIGTGCPGNNGNGGNGGTENPEEPGDGNSNPTGSN